MAHEDSKWIHLLFRGEKLSSEGCLKDDYVEEFTRHKLVATTVPVLEFKFKNLDQLAKQLENENNNGLIITSPRAVEALVRAERLLGNDLKQAQKFDSELVFVVGDKSGLECREKLNLDFNKDSAKTGNGRALAWFIRTFCNAKSNPNQINLVYPKSSLSDESIEETLTNDESSRVEIQPLVVYETSPLSNIDKILLDQIVKLGIPSENIRLVLNMIFFSPSGLNGFLEAGCEKLLIDQLEPNCNQIEIKYSSIGKKTEEALLRNNLKVFCVAERPDPQSLVRSVVQRLRAADCSEACNVNTLSALQ